MNLRSILVPGLATIAMPVFAADSLATGENRPSGSYFEDEMTSFMDFNSLEARIRLVEFHRKTKPYMTKDGSDLKKTSKVREGGDALGVQLNFKSGLVADFIGFDASLYTVGNMSSPYDKDRQLFVTKDDGTHTGFSKLGQSYVKAKVQLEDDEEPLLTFKGGRERIYTGLIAGSSSRAIPSSWQGVDIGGGIAGLHYGLAWVNRISTRNSSNFDELKSFKKKGTPNSTTLGKYDEDNKDGSKDGNSTKVLALAEKIDSIWGAELGYDLMGLSLSYKDAHAKDFLYSYNLNAGYTFNISDDLAIGVNLMYYKAKEDGKLWTGYTFGDTSFNKDADIKHINFTTNIGDLSLLLGFSKTKAVYKDKDGKKQLGRYYYDFGINTYGGFMLPTAPLVGDFFFDNEKAWVISASYKFDEFVPGLSAEASYTSGDGFKDGGKSLKEKETDIDIKYAFQGAALEGLSFRIRYGMYRPSGKRLDGSELAGDRNAKRVYLEYKSMVF
ncbi:OprD family outer membrane porin [Sansalvadorimonas verongulae]|uniref:OprD family outer membrane porin n=1 Tax=Sansalvadorimonas verongulae TaxID=2172824 RepID=UPI0012BD7E9A|nr:OprD family outer membrane porin [Sansalvadorimonas verongulae]MTI14865.1 outer membrane porin, OprD family [Sansalvadorimonas verongulae]